MHASVPGTVLGGRAAPLPLVHAQVGAPRAQHAVDRVCATLLQVEMAATLAQSAAYKTKRANDMVAQLHLDDPDARVPPALSSADEAEMANSRMEAVGAHVGACLVERYVPRLTQPRDRSATHQGHARARKVRVQGAMDDGVGQADRQSAHESPRRFSDSPRASLSSRTTTFGRCWACATRRSMWRSSSRTPPALSRARCAAWASRRACTQTRPPCPSVLFTCVSLRS